MTCIVGIEHSGRVYLAGDLQGTGWNNKVVHTQPKVFKKNGLVVGYTTSYRFGQLLEHGLPDPVIPKEEDEVYRWLISVFVRDIKKTLKDADYEKGGTCLIGVRGQLWQMQDDFSVLRSVKGYDACGSGYEYALGSLHTSVNTAFKNGNADEYVKALKHAIMAAGTFSPSVGCECTIVSTDI
jgi:ATP-dependent protease HslVU (ClpYQ) peptidase subunit